MATPPKPQPTFFSRYRWTLVGGSVALLGAVVAGIFAFSGGGNKLKPSAKPTTPVGPTPVVAVRNPPVQGKEWTNSLGMKYVPLGRIHFAALETRVKDFQAFYEATKFDATGGMYSQQADGFKVHGNSWKNPGFAQTPDHPVVGISYEDTKFFCEWLTNKERAEGALKPGQVYRLATDREWSEAAGLNEKGSETPEERSGKIRAFPWGASPTIRPDSVNFAGSEVKAPNVNPKVPSDFAIIPGYADKYPRTNPVPGYGPNARGIYDLGGNVWEWSEDLFNKRSRWRVLRGGAWSTSKPEEMLLSYRKGLDPKFRHDDVGFRCVIATDSGDR
jgi:formylglycine-generating enzyme required for sulfatase activity